MQSGARLQAAIDVLTEILERGRAASVVLADWGRAHRFAGSGDRAWIGNLVFDSLRRKQSLSYLMRSETPRSLALAALRDDWNVSARISPAFAAERDFAPPPSHPTRRAASRIVTCLVLLPGYKATTRNGSILHSRRFSEIARSRKDRLWPSARPWTCASTR